VHLEGKAPDIKRQLEINPKTNIPQILFTVYQHIFNSIFMLSSILNTPYPPPDLLHSMAEKIFILSANASSVKTEKTETLAQPESNQPSTSPAVTPSNQASADNKSA
jgi:hypothetical protein